MSPEARKRVAQLERRLKWKLALIEVTYVAICVGAMAWVLR